VNIAIKHMFRNRRQREGVRPSEPYYPPGPEDWRNDIIPGFAYTRPPTVEQRQNRTLPPAYDYNAPQELPTSYQEAPDPLKFSDFYPNGNKIRPWAHVRVPAYLAISEWESIADDTFKSGKLAALGHVVPQFYGLQNPIDFQPLIPESEYTTYGATHAIPEGQVDVPEDGYLYA
jgi:hypothetical protein